MKSRVTISVLSIVVAFFSLSLGGCSDLHNSDQISNSEYSDDSSKNVLQLESTEKSINDEISQESSSENSVSSVPPGKETFLIGLDGKAILTNEITRLENTDKTAEMLTKDDTGTMVFCDGFVYLKEPVGTAYSSYTNPEFFDVPNFDFLGEMPENKNKWKRVYVGNEICGLKLKKGSSLFYIKEYYSFPERYYSLYDHTTEENAVCEFEGTITLDGFLSINANSVQYPLDSEYMLFTPAEDKLPVMANSIDKETGYKTDFGFCTPYTSVDWACVNENSNIKLGYLKDVTCDLGKLGTGDLAYVRATFSNLKCSANIYTARLEKVELLSDILAHTDDDTTCGHGTMGR